MNDYDFDYEDMSQDAGGYYEDVYDTGSIFGDVLLNNTGGFYA